jgi:hypothetical protein
MQYHSLRAYVRVNKKSVAFIIHSHVNEQEAAVIGINRIQLFATMGPLKRLSRMVAEI